MRSQESPGGCGAKGQADATSGAAVQLSEDTDAVPKSTAPGGACSHPHCTEEDPRSRTESSTVMPQTPGSPHAQLGGTGQTGGMGLGISLLPTSATSVPQRLPMWGGQLVEGSLLV